MLSERERIELATTLLAYFAAVGQESNRTRRRIRRRAAAHGVQLEDIAELTGFDQHLVCWHAHRLASHGKATVELQQETTS